MCRFFLTLLIAGSMIFGYSVLSFAEEGEVVRGNPLQIPAVDYSKTFDIKQFQGFDRKMESPALEFKTIELPIYSGNLKLLPMTEYQISKPDFYPKSISVKEFEVKKAVRDWSQEVALKKESAFSSKKVEETKHQVQLPTKDIETPSIPTPPNLSGEKLKEAINRGSEFGKVKIGKEPGAKELTPASHPKVRVIPEKSSPPKSETSP